MNFSNEGHGIDLYNTQQVRLPVIPFPATLPGSQSSFYYQQPKTSINSESGLTSNIINYPSSRKRSRDSGEEFYGGGSQLFPQPQIQPYQLGIDAIISEHTKKMRLELQHRQKQSAKVLVAAMGESIIRRVRDKDDEIEKMARLNVMLEEKLKSLYVENNLWRELAQTNEATANSLHSDLQHALQYGGVATAAESCGSNVDDDYINKNNKIDSEISKWCYGGEKEKEEKEKRLRLCRSCGGGRCCVVLLPCRHLCLCAVCSTRIHSCPLCNSTITATLHVNMS